MSLDLLRRALLQQLPLKAPVSIACLNWTQLDLNYI